MAINNLPPQAYTRETVAQAFEWMKSQSPSTRDLAKDANTLVSLYLNAKRHKRIKNMNTADTVEFQSELKSLAKGINQFNEDSEKPQLDQSINLQRKPVNTVSDNQRDSIDQAIASLQPPQQAQVAQPAPAIITPPVQPTANISYQSRGKFINPQDILKKNNIKQAVNLPTPRPVKNSPAFKPATQKIIAQTKDALNLTSDEEALNALVAIGFKHIKSIFEL